MILETLLLTDSSSGIRWKLKLILGTLLLDRQLTRYTSEQDILRYEMLEATLGIQEAAGSYRSSYSINLKSSLQAR